MPDYKQGKIYTIRSHQTDKIYIGSTTQPLYKRFYTHKQNYKCWMNGKNAYISSFEIIKFEDAYIELVELFPCDNKMELDRKEGEHIRNIDCVNKNIAGRTEKEYYEENKTELLRKNKLRNYKRRNEINKQKSKYYWEHKKEKSEYDKVYKLKNKSKAKDRATTKYLCECGVEVGIYKRNRHNKTKEHINSLYNFEDIQKLFV